MTTREYNDNVALWADDAMRFAMRCGGSRADCEDAVQEGLAALWSHRDGVGADKGKPFLLSAAYRALMGTLRHRRVVQDHAGTLSATAAEHQRPDERFDLREAIEQCLRALPEVQRAILQLRDVEGYSYAEIADTLALSDTQVQVYLFRARVAMRKRLQQMGYGND